MSSRADMPTQTTTLHRVAGTNSACHPLAYTLKHTITRSTQCPCKKRSLACLDSLCGGIHSSLPLPYRPIVRPPSPLPPPTSTHLVQTSVGGPSAGAASASSSSHSAWYTGAPAPAVGCGRGGGDGAEGTAAEALGGGGLQGEVVSGRGYASGEEEHVWTVHPPPNSRRVHRVSQTWTG